MAFCGRCGTEAIEGNSFCTSCGAKFDNAAAAVEEPNPLKVEEVSVKQLDVRAEDEGISISEIFSKRFLAVLFLVVALAGGSWWAIGLAGDVESPYLKEEVETPSPKPNPDPVATPDYCIYLPQDIGVLTDMLATGLPDNASLALNLLSEDAARYASRNTGALQSQLETLSSLALEAEQWVYEGGDDSIVDRLFDTYDAVMATCPS